MAHSQTWVAPLCASEPPAHANDDRKKRQQYLESHLGCLQQKNINVGANINDVINIGSIRQYATNGKINNVASSSDTSSTGTIRI